MPKYQGQPFSCGNPGGRFHTDTSGQQGYPHSPLSTTPGSALPQALYIDRDDGGSLWLEHVIDSIDSNGGWDALWLMWYGKSGEPRLTMSGVFSLAELSNMTASLSEFMKAHPDADRT
jgi:hypothetical protein